ncbi:MAG: hypothetical protein JWM61_1702 [Micrococcaceae bacterium]|jgi:uncharacterized Tic20 family protein|nr:hypothetical protein [Micrococcaceae bacterium]
MTATSPQGPLPEHPQPVPGSEQRSAAPVQPSFYRPPVGPPAHELNPYEDKQWATFAHLGGLIGFVPSLVIYLVFKDRGQFARQESAEALNFQLTLLAANIVCWVFTLIPVIGILFGLALFGLWAAAIIVSILAGIAANRANPYRYPFAVRLVK